MDGDDLCDQICMNTAGSYFCSCEDGFQLLEGTNKCEGTRVAIRNQQLSLYLFWYIHAPCMYTLHHAHTYPVLSCL